MSTPQRDEYITLIDGAQEIMCGSKAIDCWDPSQLYNIAYRGASRVVPGAAGAVVRPRVRDELNADLAFRLWGAYDEDNVSQPLPDHRGNVLAYLRQIRDFFEGTDGGAFEIRLTTADGSETEPATFEAMGRVTWKTPVIAEFSVMVSIPSGLFPIPEPAS